MKGDNIHWLGNSSSYYQFIGECMSSSRASEAKLITGLGLSKELTASVSHPQPEAATRVVGQDKANSTVGANRDPIYKCNNCGKRMKLQDAVNYYGIPACPACIRAGAPFEIARETSDSGIVDGQRSTPPTQPKNL
jgi:DNA-directed RNA polymerase subunit RPC12/RpoP